VKWKIWHADGSTFSNLDGGPEDAPSYGVQVIAQRDGDPGASNVGRVLLHLHDWYYYRTDTEEWCGGDLLGLLDQLLSRSPIIAVCQGRLIPKARFNEIYQAAKADPDFPPKSAGKRGERP